MIKEIPVSEYHLVKEFAYQDVARNYFILLGLSGKKQVYESIYGEYIDGKLRAILLLRKSKVLQFYAPGKFYIDRFVELISTLEYDALIGPRSYCTVFYDKGLFTSIKDGAYISELDRYSKMDSPSTKLNIREISTLDLDEIVELYKDVFESFSSKEVMEQKLNTGRGRGVCIVEDGKIIAAAQTDFETKDSAVIVGVATKNNCRHKGLATACTQYLCKQLLKEEKDIYLQYDNLEAGRIYERLGFERIDQVIHLRR